MHSGILVFKQFFSVKHFINFDLHDATKLDPTLIPRHVRKVRAPCKIKSIEWTLSLFSSTQTEIMA